PNPGYRISPGMSAKILFRIHEADHTPVLTVPQDALVTAPDGSESVWKVAGEEKGFVVNPVAVTTGRHFDGSVEITAGSIGAGDRLVVRGNEILKSGQQVHLLDQAAD
ncbi:MAG: efflux RND transporter periplasmic adaptor subunit, partial [Gammaproteobacteria bacterium]